MSITANVTPLYSRILVKELKRGEKTSGGLWVPDMVRDGTPYVQAEVLAVGHGRPTMSGALVPLRVKEGDVVVYARTSGTRDAQIAWPLADGSEAWIILEDHICLIVNDLPRTTGVLGADGRELVTPGVASS